MNVKKYVLVVVPRPPQKTTVVLFGISQDLDSYNTRADLHQTAVIAQ